MTVEVDRLWGEAGIEFALTIPGAHDPGLSSSRRGVIMARGRGDLGIGGTAMLAGPRSERR